MTHTESQPIDLKTILIQQRNCFSTMVDQTTPFAGNTEQCTADNILSLLDNRGVSLQTIDQLEHHRKFSNPQVDDDETIALHSEIKSLSEQLFRFDEQIMHTLSTQRLQTVREMSKFSSKRHRSTDLWNDNRIQRRIVDISMK